MTKKRLYIVIRRKGKKKFVAAVPLKKFATKQKILDLLKRLKRNFSVAVVTTAQLKKLIVKQTPKLTGKKRLTRKTKTTLHKRKTKSKRRKRK